MSDVHANLSSARPNRVKQLRLARAPKLSQAGVSVGASISPNTIILIEKWHHYPGPDIRARLAQFFGVTEADIWPVEQSGTTQEKIGQSISTYVPNEDLSRKKLCPRCQQSA